MNYLNKCKDRIKETHGQLLLLAQIDSKGLLLTQLPQKFTNAIGALWLHDNLSDHLSFSQKMEASIMAEQMFTGIEQDIKNLLSISGERGL